MSTAIAYALTTCPQFVTFTGRNAEWADTHIPRTDRPVRFVPRFQGMTLAIPSLPVSRIA